MTEMIITFSGGDNAHRGCGVVEVDAPGGPGIAQWFVDRSPADSRV